MPIRVSAALVELATKPHALYRFFDRTDVLLYVGVTADLPTRLSKHRKGRPWWVDVDHITIEHFVTREEVLAAEVEAIRTERPLWNRQHNELVPLPAQLAVLQDGTGKSDLATRVIETITGTVGDEWLGEAAGEALHDLSLPEDERTHPGESDEVVLTALELVDATAANLGSFRFVLERLLESLPVELREHCESEARDDWRKAGEPNPPQIVLLPHILRHLGYVLRDHFAPASEGAAR